MIIVSKINRDCKINFSNTEVEFDKEQKAKVSKELGEQIIKNFPNMYWEEGKKAKEVVLPKDSSDDAIEVQKLKTEVERLQIIVNDKTKMVTLAKEGEQSWRDAFQKLQDEMNGKVGGEETPIVPEPKNEEKTEENSSDEFVVPEKHKDLYEGMKTKNFPSLKKWIKDSFNKTDEDIKGIATRDDLIKFVFDNCNIED